MAVITAKLKSWAGRRRGREPFLLMILLSCMVVAATCTGAEEASALSGGPANAEVTVTFDANGGTVSQTTKKVEQEKKYGDLPEATRTGYKFEGWYTEKEKGTKITKDSTVSIAGDHTLYAHWKGEKYTVTFDATGGSVYPGTQTVTYGSPYGTLPTPTRAGYTFNGWYTDTSYTTEITRYSTVDTIGAHTLYARWTANKYTVRFDANGGIVSQQSTEVTYDSAYGTLPEPTRTGYAFAGWSKELGGDPVTEKTIVRTAEDHTLHANWIANTYVVSFDGNGGTAQQQSTDVTYDSAYGTLPEATRTGYTFNGWFTMPDGGEEVTASTKVSIVEDQTLYAHWTANKYTVRFDPNKGNVSASEITVTYDSTYEGLPSTMRTGYTFNGWFTELDGGEEVTTSTKVSILEDQTLYAHWTANNYTVRFDPNKGNVSASEITVTYDSTYEGLPSTMRTGYTFNGWFTELDGGEEVTASTKVSITDEQMLYAHWTANNYTVTFNTTGGYLNETTKVVTFDGFYGDLPIPTKKGHGFFGWWLDDDVEVLNSTIVSIAEDHTLYARYAKNKGLNSTQVALISVFTSLFVVIIVAVALFVLFKYRWPSRWGSSKELTKSLIDVPASSVAVAAEDAAVAEGVGAAVIAGGVYEEEIPEFFSRIANEPAISDEEEITRGKSLNSIYRLYPKGSQVPTLEAALDQSSLDDDLRQELLEACRATASKAMALASSNGTALPSTFTEADAAAVALYTYDFGPGRHDENPNVLINKALLTLSTASIQNVRDMLRIVMTSLRKMPKTPPGTLLYRGVQKIVDKNYYREGNVVTWIELLSASDDKEGTMEMLNNMGTLFVIKEGWGYQIHDFASSPERVKEVCLEPERKLIVEEVGTEGDMTVITLRMIETPIVLTNIFGEPQ